MKGAGHVTPGLSRDTLEENVGSRTPWYQSYEKCLTAPKSGHERKLMVIKRLNYRERRSKVTRQKRKIYCLNQKMTRQKKVPLYLQNLQYLSGFHQD